MCVEDRCTIVTSAPFSHSAPQMSKAELLDADDHAPLAAVGVRARVGRGVVLVAAEDVHAREAPGGSACRTCRWRGPAASGAAVSGWPSRSTSTVHSPVASSYAALRGLGAGPVVAAP